MISCVPPHHRPHRPTHGCNDSQRDECVHGGGTMSGIHGCRLVEWSGRPHHHRQRQHQSPPLPPIEHQRGNHRKSHHREPCNQRHREPCSQHGNALHGFFVEHVWRGVFQQSCPVTRLLHLSNHLLGGDRIAHGDSCGFRRKVDRGGDTLDLVERLFDLGCARPTRHARNGQIDLFQLC